MERKKYSLDELHLGRSTSNLIDETQLNFVNPPRLYMGYSSPPCRAVILVAAALGVPLQLIQMDILNGEHLRPDYIEKNPQHTIPMLEDNGFIVWESHAICGYLVTAYGRNDNLYPHEPKRRAIIDQRLHFDSSILFVSLRALIVPLITGATVLSQDHIKDVDEALMFLEKFLNNSKWLAGDSVTIADLCSIATVTSIDELLPLDEEKYTNVCQWMNRCKKLPYYEENNVKGLKLFGEMVKSFIK